MSESRDIQELTEKFQSLNGWEQGVVLISTSLLKIKKEEVDMMVKGLGRMFAWHEKQHANHQKCDYCILLEEHVQAIKVIRMHVDNNQKLGEENK